MDIDIHTIARPELFQHYTVKGISVSGLNDEAVMNWKDDDVALHTFRHDG